MKNKLPIIVCINVIIYCVFIILILGGLIQKLIIMQPWEGFVAYSMVMLVVVLITLVILFGLIKMKNWARVWAVCWNFFSAFALIGLHLAFYFIMKNNDRNVSFGETLTIDIIFRFVLGIIFLFLAVSLNTKKTKRYFEV